jgi:hypothetical protein
MTKSVILLVSLVTVVAPLSAQTESIGSFHYRRLIDNITDADRSLVYTTNVDARPLRTARLVWRCNRGRIELMLRADSLNTGPATIRWRVDELLASPDEEWRPGTSGVSVFAPPESAAALARAAQAAGRLVIRIKNPDGTNLDYIFEITAGAAAIGRLACVDPFGGLRSSPEHTP